MIHRAVLSAPTILATAILATPTLATEPCIPGVDLLPAVVAPQDGSTSVPVNVKPVIARSTIDAPARLLIGDVEVPHAIERFDIEDGFGTTEMTRLLPAADLPAGVEVRLELADGTAVTFTTGDARDEQAPAAPTLQEARNYSGGACTPFLEIPVAGDADSAVFIARTGGQPELQGDANLNGMAVDDVIVVSSGEASSNVLVFVAAVDLAGNVSEATSPAMSFSPTKSPFRTQGVAGTSVAHAGAATPEASACCSVPSCWGSQAGGVDVERLRRRTGHVGRTAER